MPGIKGKLTVHVINQENVTHNQEKKVQSIGADPKITQMFKLAD